MRVVAAGIVLLTVMARLPGVHAQAPGRTPTASTALTPGATVERTIAADERHELTLDLLAQQVIKITADQLGVDLRVALNSDTQLPTGETDDQSKQYGPRNMIVWLAPASGSLRISVL